jgi:hypothetical protein
MMASNPDNVKTRKGKEGDTYYENTALAERLKKLKKPVNAVAGKASGDRSKARAKGRQYVERKRGSTPTKRTVAGGPNQSAQPMNRPQNMQGPVMRNGAYGGNPNATMPQQPLSLGASSPPPAQTFAQNGMSQYRPMMPQYGFDAMPPGQPMQQPMMQQRPSAFGQPNSAMTMGIQPMGNPYMNSQNPAQVMQGYQPPMNPWGRRW